MRSSWLGAVALVLAAASPAALRAQDLEETLVPGVAEVGVAVAAADVLTDRGEYWLGVEASVAGPALRAQLGLPEHQGLVVEHVLPESPAAAAGVKRYDVLLKANDKPLGSVMDLVQAIGQAKEGKLALELVRGGKHQTVTATPAKRPEGKFFHRRVPPPGTRAERENIEKWIEQFAPGQGGDRGNLRFQFINPGMLPGMAGPPALPEGMSLSITKEGKSPAKIVVKQGDKKWETTEDHLDKLPEKVRPAVERMLGRGPMGIGTFTVPVPPPGEFNTPLGVPREFHPLPDVERRLQDMNRQIEELRRSIRDLRQERRQSRERQPEKPVEKSPAHTEHI